MADPNKVTRGEGIWWRLIKVTFTINFIIFVINSRTNAIKLCSKYLWTTQVRITSTSFLKSNMHACKSYNLELDTQFLSPFIMKKPCNDVWQCSNAKFSCLSNYQQTCSYQLKCLNFIEHYDFLLYIISHLCKFEWGGGGGGLLKTLLFTYVYNSHVWPLDFSTEHQTTWPSGFNALRNTDLRIRSKSN